ncbi:MAG: NADH-quinone oxidoreductase subunit J [Steroidobacteraceae bacterium]
MVQILFFAFALVLLAAALGVIISKNPVHSALCLVLTFFSAAAIWLLLEAEFLAIVLVLVYVGAVMVLFLFVVMMLDINVEELRRGYTQHLWLGITTALVVVLEIVGVVVAKGFGPKVDMKAGMVATAVDASNTTELGTALYTRYLYPFELAAVLLLVAIIAAIVLTMRKRQGLKVQDISAQVAVRSQDRVRIIKMPAERPE